MKTPEQWMNQFGKFPNDQKQEEEVFKLAKLPESMLPKVSFWNSVLTENDIEQIQDDARKELEQQLSKSKAEIEKDAKAQHLNFTTIVGMQNAVEENITELNRIADEFRNHLSGTPEGDEPRIVDSHISGLLRDVSKSLRIAIDTVRQSQPKQEGGE